MSAESAGWQPALPAAFPRPAPLDHLAVGGDPAAKLGDLAAAAGIRGVEVFAWRDLDHPEAGGSELHAARLAERWAEAGLDVTINASRAAGAPRSAHRDGYRVRRPAGRYSVFASVAAGRLARRLAGRGRPGYASVEIWNGMPFFSPLWAPRPRMVFLHHVHDGMWDLVLPRSLAATGRLIEGRLAPPIYGGTPVVTLSESSRRAIIDMLGFTAQQVSVVPPGVDESFCPGPRRSPVPLVVAVGRLVPYKRFDRLVEVLVQLRRHHPDLRAVIAGEGTERRPLEQLVASHGAGEWLDLPGRVDDDTLTDLYQRAWVLASTSAYEGWGMTISEAAACATPSVATPIAGHRDAVLDGVTGFLAEPGEQMERALDALIRDRELRRRMQDAAVGFASELTWDRSALESLRVLAAQGTTPREPTVL